MAQIQNNYAEDYRVGWPGMVSNGETSNIISRTIETAGGVGFGRPVFRGVGDHGIAVTGVAAAFLGVTLGHYAPAPSRVDGSYIDGYPQYAEVPVKTLGGVWVTAGAAVADGDQAYATPAGAITNVVAGNIIMAGWFFDTSAAAGSSYRTFPRDAVPKPRE